MLKQYPNIANHLHIPLQSGSKKILKAMNRKYNLDEFKETIDKIREIRNDISITTDVIVGFPEETEKEFTETIETVKKFAFSKIHVFPYSRRKGTKADMMDHQVDEKVKKERTRRLIAVSNELESKYRKQFLGRTLSVIVETYKDGYLMGHTGNYFFVKVKGK